MTRAEKCPAGLATWGAEGSEVSHSNLNKLQVRCKLISGKIIRIIFNFTEPQEVRPYVRH